MSDLPSREVIAESDVIIAVNKATGTEEVYFGKSLLQIIRDGYEESGLRCKVLRVPLDYDSDEPEWLAAACLTVKGNCDAAMESDRPIDDAAKEIDRAEREVEKSEAMIDAFDLEYPVLGIEAATENRMAAYDVPEIPSPNDPGRPITLCYDCWDKAGQPEAEQETDDAVLQLAKEHDPARYEKLIRCEHCGVKFGFVKE